MIRPEIDPDRLALDLSIPEHRAAWARLVELDAESRMNESWDAEIARGRAILDEKERELSDALARLDDLRARFLRESESQMARIKLSTALVEATAEADLDLPAAARRVQFGSR